MRTARVVKRTYGWVVVMGGPGNAECEYRFDEWTDALAWAVRMVGA